MDTITHGIAGALIGKAFFADRFGVAAAFPSDASGGNPATPAGRVAVFAAALGAVFPDFDSFLGWFDRSGLAVIETHRAETHSFLCLPLFALALAWLTRRFCLWRKIACPSFASLTAVYAAGIALHIFLDLITSFGTMIWAPLNYSRVSWDLAFILDFTLTAIVLLPQVAAWVFHERDASLRRGMLAWIFFALLSLGIQRLAVANEVAFSSGAVFANSAILAALFFLPQIGARGFRVPRRAWCRAGVVLFALYLGGCVLAHRAALKQVEAFAAQNRLTVESIGALPMPPWMARWSGLIRTPQGVFYASVNLLAGEPPRFEFLADSLPNGFTDRVRALREVQSFLRFARFPVIRYSEHPGRHIVELLDVRFMGRRANRPSPFTYRITLDDAGRVMAQGWVDE